MVKKEDLAMFNGVLVHPFYATFSLGRDAEWCCRQFVLKSKSENEEGIGTFLNIKHVSPALLGETVVFTATISQIQHNEIICNFEAKVSNRLIAIGKQGQKIILKEKVNQIIGKINEQKD